MMLPEPVSEFPRNWRSFSFPILVPLTPNSHQVCQGCVCGTEAAPYRVTRNALPTGSVRRPVQMVHVRIAQLCDNPGSFSCIPRVTQE